MFREKDKILELDCKAKQAVAPRTNSIPGYEHSNPSAVARTGLRCRQPVKVSSAFTELKPRCASIRLTPGQLWAVSVNKVHLQVMALVTDYSNGLVLLENRLVQSPCCLN